MHIATAKFHGGPADGKTIQFMRLPKYLRVTTTAKGICDVLDMPDDRPLEEERLSVYRIDGEISVVHIDSLEGGRRVGRWLRTANYRFLDDQPPDEVLRDHDRWVAWAMAMHDADERRSHE